MIDKRDKLFNITYCHCLLPITECDKLKPKCEVSDCKSSHYDCLCNLPYNQQIPKDDRAYFHDQIFEPPFLSCILI